MSRPFVFTRSTSDAMTPIVVKPQWIKAIGRAVTPRASAAPDLLFPDASGDRCIAGGIPSSSSEVSLMRRCYRLLVFTALALCLGLSSAFAQATSSLRGKVTDAQGGAL